MRKHRASTHAAVLLLLHLQAAYTVYQPVPLSNVAPRSEVLVRFPSPAPVMIGTKRRDSVQFREIPAVRTVRGRFISIVADTMQLSPVSFVNAPRIGAGQTLHSALFPVSATTPVAVRRFDSERTTFLVVGLAAAAAFVVYAAIGSMDYDFGSCCY